MIKKKLKQVVCFFMLHDYRVVREEYGRLTNDKVLYKEVIGDCIRCGRPFEKK